MIDQLAWVTSITRLDTTRLTVATWPDRIDEIALNTSTAPARGSEPWS